MLSSKLLDAVKSKEFLIFNNAFLELELSHSKSKVWS